MQLQYIITLNRTKGELILVWNPTILHAVILPTE